MFELELLIFFLKIDEQKTANFIYESMGKLDDNIELSSYFYYEDSICETYIPLLKSYFPKFIDTHIKFLMKFFIELVNECELLKLVKQNQNLDNYIFKCCDKCNKKKFIYKNHSCCICEMILSDIKLIDLMLDVNREIYSDKKFKYIYNIKNGDNFNELKISEVNKSFSLFRLEIDLSKCFQWKLLFKDNKTFKLIQEKNVFKDLISVVRNFMVPHLFIETDFNITFEEISNMSFKKWNMFYNKKIDSFYILKNKDKFVIKDSNYYLTQAKHFYDKDKKYQIYDLKDLTNCFILTQRYIIESCKDLLNILKMLDDLKNQDKLTKFMTDGKIKFLSTSMYNVIKDVHNCNKSNIMKNGINLSENFFKFNFIKNINKNIQDILEKKLRIDIPKNIKNTDEYSPEKVDEEIQKLKNVFKK